VTIQSDKVAIRAL